MLALATDNAVPLAHLAASQFYFGSWAAGGRAVLLTVGDRLDAAA